MADHTNWAGNIRYQAARVHHPATVDDVSEIVAGVRRARAVGTGHSFNTVADTEGDAISMAGLDLPFELDSAHRRVRAGAGARYGELARWLHGQGWALANLASLPHISVAGAISTGTHGSGDRNQSLAAAVAAVELVRADGHVQRFERGHRDFAGVVVSLGALGVITAVELDVEPAFAVAQTVYESVPFDEVLTHFDAITGSGYSVSLFSTLQDPGRIDQMWRKDRVDAAGAVPDLLAGREASGKRHMLPGVSAQFCTEQGGVPGPWLDRLPHFKLEFTPSNGAEIQSEYLFDRAQALAAAEALRGLSARIAPVLQVCEIRTVAADDLWLSAAYERDTVGFHFTWRLDPAGVAEILPVLERAFIPLGARPHWGKAFHHTDVSALYPRWADFVAVKERLDPDRVFANEFTTAFGL